MTGTQTRNEIINLRASRRQKELIDQAAELLDSTRSDFMLEAACREAQALLVDQTRFSLPENKFKRFMAALDKSPKESQASTAASVHGSVGSISLAEIKNAPEKLQPEHDDPDRGPE